MRHSRAGGNPEAFDALPALIKKLPIISILVNCLLLQSIDIDRGHLLASMDVLSSGAPSGPSAETCCFSRCCRSGDDRQSSVAM
jgi:hypothetical protein